MTILYAQNSMLKMLIHEFSFCSENRHHSLFIALFHENSLTHVKLYFNDLFKLYTSLSTLNVKSAQQQWKQCYQYLNDWYKLFHLNCDILFQKEFTEFHHNYRNVYKVKIIVPKASLIWDEIFLRDIAGWVCIEIDIFKSCGKIQIMTNALLCMFVNQNMPCKFTSW